MYIYLSDVDQIDVLAKTLSHITSFKAGTVVICPKVSNTLTDFK